MRAAQHPLGPLVVAGLAEHFRLGECERRVLGVGGAAPAQDGERPLALFGGQGRGQGVEARSRVGGVQGRLEKGHGFGGVARPHRLGDESACKACRLWDAGRAVPERLQGGRVVARLALQGRKLEVRRCVTGVRGEGGPQVALRRRCIVREPRPPGKGDGVRRVDC